MSNAVLKWKSGYYTDEAIFDQMAVSIYDWNTLLCPGHTKRFRERISDIASFQAWIWPEWISYFLSLRAPISHIQNFDLVIMSAYVRIIVTSYTFHGHSHHRQLYWIFKSLFGLTSFKSQSFALLTIFFRKSTGDHGKRFRVNAQYWPQRYTWFLFKIFFGQRRLWIRFCWPLSHDDACMRQLHGSSLLLIIA